jgi:hypothetical protein
MYHSDWFPETIVSCQFKYRLGQIKCLSEVPLYPDLFKMKMSLPAGMRKWAPRFFQFTLCPARATTDIKK